MVWLWNEWEEYVDAVQPVALVRPGRLRGAQRNTWFENGCHLWTAARKLEETACSLQKLGFTGSDEHRSPPDLDVTPEVHHLVLEAVHAGEELLLFNKRLAIADASYGFLHQKDILDHWERYSATGRISAEIHQLVKDIGELLSGYHGLVSTDYKFIISNLDLPDSLESEFRLARNLFSAGFDYVGLLISGRGLEGVLRQIAKVRKISLQLKKVIPAHEADTHDLIEAMYHVKWEATGLRLISQETRALLHYMRTLRNGAAHPNSGAKTFATTREAAVLISDTANRLWKQVSTSRARLEPKTVIKNW